MHINDDHLYHGAALTQIAEYPTFKAINAFEVEDGEKSRSAFIVNHDTGIYLKYASKPSEHYREYVFTFTTSNLGELKALTTHYDRVFVVLVCIRAKEICVLTFDEFEKHRSKRETAFGGVEPQYQLLVTARTNKGFRVYMNQPGKRKLSLPQQTVARRRFPRAIFE